MRIYPAIDIKEGQCVRLLQGDFNKETVYSINPLEVASKWERLNAEFIHVVDLDGAKTGASKNLTLIIEMAAMLNTPIQVGGGIRNMEMVDKLISNGIQRVILGTSAVKNPEFLKQAVDNYKEKIVVGIDAKDGKAAVDGWLTTSEFEAVDFAKRIEQLGVKTIIYTDISKDGMLLGPNLDAMTEMASETKMDVICSGGIGCLNDIISLKNTGVSGVIIGKALYTGNVDLQEAIRAAKSDKF